MFNCTISTKKLALRHQFGIARSTRTHVTNVFVELERDGIIGIGEASPNTRYMETPESCRAFIEKVDWSNLPNPFNLTACTNYFDTLQEGEYAAKVALEMALADWMGKVLQVPLFDLWNAPRSLGPKSSFTIGIDSIEMIKQKIIEAESYPILKVKLGGGNDKEIISTIRDHTEKSLWVDANEGWKTFEEALDMVRFLEDYGIEMIEQPMPALQKEESAQLLKETSIPIIADEGFTGHESLDQISRCYSGINIKLMKIGSMARALKTIAHARELGLKVMIGCMIETSLANTAGAILSLWADYADLDGYLLLKDQPFSGLGLNEEHQIILNEMPGLGVIKL